ncbi:MAG: hypothetical protein L6461_23555 [Anaerolineae bacterium]|nr:hypothetical protein [Anaerolineae bacterium]
MEGVSENTEQEYWECENCGGQGSIFFPNEIEASHYILCANCSTSWIWGWCVRCNEIDVVEIKQSNKKAHNWKCQNCQAKNAVPIDFYVAPIYFRPEKFSIRVVERAGNHITIPWIKTTINWWHKNGNLLAYIAMVSFGVFIFALFADLPSLISIIAFFIWTLSFALIFIIELLCRIISRVFALKVKSKSR